MSGTGSGKIWPYYSSEDTLQRITKAVASGVVYDGSSDNPVREFEQLFSHHFCEGAYSIFLNSGTSALLAAYKALGIGAGDEVLCTTNTFRATATPLMILSATPVFCDVHDSNGLINLKDAAARVSKKTRCLVTTHMWSQPCDTRKLRTFADNHHLSLIEDCSHAHGSTWRGRPVGQDADVAIFSVGTTKMVSGGQGGVLTTRSLELYERATVYAMPSYRFKELSDDHQYRKIRDTGGGVNLRGGVIEAILASEHLSQLETVLEDKNRMILGLDEILRDLSLPLRLFERPSQWDQGTWYMRPVLWQSSEPDLASFLEYCKQKKLRISKAKKPLHQLKGFAAIGLTQELPVADELIPRTLLFDTRDMYSYDEDILDHYKSSLEAGYL